jgi:hypothetical protein
MDSDIMGEYLVAINEVAGYRASQQNVTALWSSNRRPASSGAQPLNGRVKMHVHFASRLIGP